jgi:uncharacterized membrane protein YhaH (DUF805 family)
MSENTSPYEVSRSGMSPVSPPQMPVSAGSPIPKVFGIIHLCYAVLGVVFSFLGVAAMVGMKMLAEKGGDEFKEMKPLIDAWEGMASFMYVDVALKVILGLILFVAGVGLLKRKVWSVKLSVFWSVSRIVAAVGMLLWGMSVTASFQEKLAPVKDAQQEQIQQMSQSVGNVVGIVIILIYPVVSLVFLTRKSVRDALEASENKG